MISGFTSLGCGWRRKPPDMAANILDKKLPTATKRWSPWLGMGLTPPHHKNQHVTQEYIQSFKQKS
jgi:hypothetical protein